MNFKYEVATLLSSCLNKNIDTLLPLIEVPKNKMGDFAFPCFSLAKEFKKSPVEIAEHIEKTFKTNDFITSAKAIGPYLNFYVNKQLFISSVINDVIGKQKDFGKSSIGKDKMVVLDYSSPNIAKPFHVGHLRSTVIGQAIDNIHQHLGYNTYSINYLGDWGTQFGKLIVAFKRWGDKETVERDDIKELVRLYVKFHDEAENDKSLEDEARNWLLKMENGDEEALQLWAWIKNISLIEFNRIYDLLGVSFDSFNGESFYNNKMTPVIDELKDKKLLIKDDGASIVSLDDFNMPPCLILRRDGGTLYHTRDLASVMYRKNTFDFHKAIYITGGDQILHFKQLFKVVELMGYEWAKNLEHASFGLVSLESGKISTRRGVVVLMEELLTEAINKTLAIIEEKNPTLKNKEEVAKDVGIGAIIFNDLFNGRKKDVVFSWDKMLSFDGETGPYVQYTCARANSVLRKSKIYDFSNIDYNLIANDEVLHIATLLNDFTNKLIDAKNKSEPYILTRHIIDIAKAYNKFYHDYVILDDDINVRNARLSICYSVKTVLTIGLNILGINSPEEM